MKKLLIILFFSSWLSSNESSSNISDKTWSISIGLGTNKSFSFLCLSKDFKINNNFSYFVNTGYGYSIIGTGLSFQNNYNNKGFNIAINNGLQLIDELEKSKYFIWHATGNYQLKVGQNIFLSYGLMAGIHYNYGGEECYYGDCVKTSEKSAYILPTISIDYRF